MIETLAIVSRIDKSHIYWGEVIRKIWIGRYRGEEVLGYMQLTSATNIYHITTDNGDYYANGDEAIQFFALTKSIPSSVIWIDLT